MVSVVVGDAADVDEHPVPRLSTATTAHVAFALGGLGGWVALVAVAVVWGRHLLDTGIRLGIGAAPLAGYFEWRVTHNVWVPIVFAVAVVGVGPALAARLQWRRLIVLGSLCSGLWAIALSRIDGPRTFVKPFRSPAYLQTARLIHDPHAFLAGFVAHIHSYNSHARGHPPGMELLLWATARIGLAGLGWNAFLAVAGGATAGAAALIVLRDVTNERTPRAVVPFIVLAPAAVWWSSGDAFFAGVSACAVACVVLATARDGRRSDRLAVIGGLLFGVTAFLSYGLVLLAFIPVAVAVARHKVRPLVAAACGAVPVFVGFAALGFSWFAGLAATRTQYWLGAASGRPFRYFVIADIAAFALAVGPAVAVALVRLRDRRVWLLVGGALAAIALADLSALSKAEVERIWLPFVPWALLATAAFAADRSRRSYRFWLGLQAASAVVIQMAVRSPW